MFDFKTVIAELANTVAAQAAIKAAQYVLAERPIPHRFISTKVASEYLGLSVDVLQLWRAQGRGPKYRRMYRSVRYDVQALDAWMCGLAPGIDGTFVSGHEETQIQNGRELTP